MLILNNNKMINYKKKVCSQLCNINKVLLHKYLQKNIYNSEFDNKCKHWA